MKGREGREGQGRWEQIELEKGGGRVGEGGSRLRSFVRSFTLKLDK